ncbi:hypothetical protein Scep_012851 [Stephania cephalantha]|uniref:Cytochrome P450 n=1 Tax=Stephania cephalantha TaxID=152367 RepID=A0AAP0JHP6_9MAGN
MAKMNSRPIYRFRFFEIWPKEVARFGHPLFRPDLAEREELGRLTGRVGVSRTSVLHIYHQLFLLMDFLFILFFITTLVLTVYKLRLIKPIKKNLPPSPLGALPIIGHLRLVLSATPFHRTLQALSSNSTQYADYMFLKLRSQRHRPFFTSRSQECIHKNDVAFANRPHSIAFDYYSYNYTQISMTDYALTGRETSRFLRSVARRHRHNSHDLRMGNVTTTE